jgi:predicted transcriptional regulator
MRVVKGKVVGNTVVLDEALPDGSEVEVVLRAVGGDAAGWDVSDEDWAELDASMAEADKGLLVPADKVLDRLASILKQ